jgi:hypothetical protein
VGMGGTLVWPAVALLGFLVFTGLVVALGSSSTARYEFERNRTREPQRSAAVRTDAHPAGRRSVAAAAGDAGAQAQPQAVGLAVRPSPAPGQGNVPAWWLVDGSTQVLAGPFVDRLDADWAAVTEGLPAVAVFGARRADGAVAVRPSPQELSWLSELGEQLDRLPEDWDTLLSDTDPLTTLVVEVAAALVEAGLPLHETASGRSAGGVCLMPAPGLRGVLVSWRPHDRMSLDRVRGAGADAAVQRLMNSSVTEVLVELGFEVETSAPTGCPLVTGRD